MELYRIKRGDAYAIPLKLRLGSQSVAVGDIERVEASLDRHVRRTYPEDMEYDAEADAFYFRLTQAETLSLGEGLTLPLDVRVRFLGGDVIGTTAPAAVLVVPSASGREL